MWMVIWIFVIGIPLVVDGCWPGSKDSWSDWSECSAPCGGGTHKRSQYVCFRSNNHQTGNCNEFCYNGGSYHSGACHCTEWRHGQCCDQCKTDYYIAHCEPNSVECGGSPDNVKCTNCTDPYYSGGYGGGCKLCPSITNCKTRNCTSPENIKCIECLDNNYFFKRTHSDTQCERMCSWNNHYCWPGSCSSDELVKSCHCAPGFEKVLVKDKETSCQLSSTNTPTIGTCEAWLRGSSGQMKQAQTTRATRECKNMADFYGNFQPQLLTIDVSADFSVNISSTFSQPKFISEYTFGVTDVTVFVSTQTITGSITNINTTYLRKDDGTGTNAGGTVFSKANITNLNVTKLQDGERLCVKYEAKAGGYLKSYDLTQSTRKPSPPVSYRKTVSYRRLCYRFDISPPVHCAQTSTCSSKPLHLSSRITRSPTIHVEFEGWLDPFPDKGNKNHASGIESYAITVHNVDTSSGLVKDINTGSPVLTKKVNKDITSVVLNLTFDTPKLLSIRLEVKDVADNVRHARRFVLIDNSSFIETQNSNDFYVASASKKTNHTWQTNHNELCVSWKNYFYNKYYFENPVLNHIEPDSSQFDGVYEQSDKPLPISGTPNIHGIIGFLFAWKRNEDNVSSEITVPHFEKQFYCHKLSVKDGDTYTLNIRAVDIVNHTYAANRTISIDGSVPDINNICLMKNGEKQLFVHNELDLSKMELYFESLDPHSGIRTIEWAFGTSDGGKELIVGHTGPRRTKNVTCPKDEIKCYCPDVGACEKYAYTIRLRDLVKNNKHLGDHNRNYFFSVKVTNNALLTNIEHLDVLIDDSPPVPGVVFEGPLDGHDIDYTSDDSFQVHWHGFIDHESGIKRYKVAVANRCLSSTEMANSSVTDILPLFIEVPFPETSAKVSVNLTSSTYFTNVAAINNALDISETVCSDGITLDKTPPRIRNITIQHSKWVETLLCEGGKASLLRSNLKLVNLYQTLSCIDRCTNSTSYKSIADILPLETLKIIDEDTSDFLCMSLPSFNSEVITYLPHDHLYLQWDVETGLSQVEDFQVGIANGASEFASPGIIDYISSNKRHEFKIQNIGVGSANLFYVFIKAINKAGLISVATIGPLLVDETPPDIKYKPVVNISDTEVIVAWGKDTFYDLDQKEQISQLYFEIGVNGKTVTPLMEWRLDYSINQNSKCLNTYEFCIKYPLGKLQGHDTDNGSDFYFTLYVYNNAGHSTKLDTEKFKIPSKYPPGKAVVLDTDPKYFDGTIDVDMHFTASTMCARWKGFRHHEHLKFEVGVGTDRNQDNILKFKDVASVTNFCFTSSLISSNVRYYFLVRATCSGGQTLSASDGVVMITQDYINKELKVHVGKNCEKTNPFTILYIHFSGPDSMIRMNSSLQIGASYVFYAPENVIIVEHKDQGILNSIPSTRKGSKGYSFVPTVERPLFYLHNVSESIYLNFIECKRNSQYIADLHTIESFWFYEDDNVLPMEYDIALKQSSNHNVSDSAIKFRERTNSMSLTVNSLYIKTGNTYYIDVSPCIRNQCLKPVTSKTFTISRPLKGRINVAEMAYFTGSSCFNVTMEWHAFTTTSPMLFYQWVVSKDVSSKKTLRQWKTIHGIENIIKVNECIYLPNTLHKTMFACVRGFAEDGQSFSTCKEFNITTPGQYRRETIYDIDIKQSQWPKIKEAIASSNIGVLYRTLHDSELDIGNHESKVAGVILYGTERHIEWFLMERPMVPTTCDTKTGCILSLSTHIGYIEIEQAVIKPNILHYICAFSNSTSIERELFVESFEEIRACSNGFIIDNSAPASGKVFVTNTNGYLNDLSRIVISWDHFIDNIDASLLGYIDGIKSYSYGIGKIPREDDIVKFTDVGLSKLCIANMTGIPDGEEIFISIKATDHAGLTALATSPALIIDVSPPMFGTLLINRYVTTDTITVRLLNFHDDESGIDFFEVSIGTSPILGDIIPTAKTSAYQLELKMPETLQDGNEYYVNVRATNRAGLTSNNVAESFILDRSAPTGGHILDGNSYLKTDQDFQEDVHHISAHWKGFDDVHSDLHFYRVGLGSEPYLDDVEPMIAVGLNTDVMWNGSFILGQRYYVMVEACNNAGLCVTRSSNGIVVDNSPPLKGLVKVGSGGHQKYIPKSSSVHLEWYGFEDPQSDLDHFEACIGTAPEKCDILPYFHCLLHSSILKADLTLPTSQSIYATVKAYNKVGMFVSQSSDTFRVDETPPTIIYPASFVFDYNNTEQLVQWEPSVLSISWQFEDKESPIVSHTIALKTHHDGHTPIELLQLGSENTKTIILDENNWLKSGDRYFVLVTCCNAAGLCKSSQSKDLLIDSTPPHIGGFKPPMKWKTEKDSKGELRSEVSLIWYGFHDQESGIENFFITVSRSYSGDELSNGVIVAKANKSDVQEISFKLQDAIKRNDKIILSIWALNKAGMNSSIARVSVDALSMSSGLSTTAGFLELEKHSCKTHYCNNDCTCAVVGKPCTTDKNIYNCTNLDTSVLNNHTYPVVDVMGGLRNFRYKYTSSSACLAGHWNLQDGDMNVSRFEWSMGLYNQPVGEGIFNLNTEIPWKDVGLQTHIVHCLPTNHNLLHNNQYLVYVKVWYSPELSRIFKSDPIIIDHTPPSVRTGKFVKVSDLACVADYDFIDWMDTITACWGHVFSERESRISHFSVSLGTSPNADDVFSRTNAYLNTSITLTNLTLSHGTKYYVNIAAYNNLGLQNSTSSDGFIVDMDTPVAGVVFNTERHRNKAYLSSNKSVSFSWHGFIDHHSGIKTYFAAVLEETQVGVVSPTFTYVGIRNAYTFSNQSLEHGKSYVGIVKAVDAAGHASPLSFSPAVTVDWTPPNGLACMDYLNIINENITCSTDGTYIFEKDVQLTKNNLYKICGNFNKRDASTSVLLKVNRLTVEMPIFDHYDQSSHFKYVHIPVESANTSIHISGICTAKSTVSVIISSCIDAHIAEDGVVELRQFSESEVSIETTITDEESRVQRIYIGLGTRQGSYQIKPLTQVHTTGLVVLDIDVNQGTPVYATIIAENYAGLRTKFYSRPIIIDKTPPVFTQPPLVTFENNNNTHDFNVTWAVDDQETGIQQCICALGNGEGHIGILEFRTSTTDRTCIFQNVTIEHGDILYAHVHCVNGRELVTKSISEPVTILLKPPVSKESSVSIIPTNAVNFDAKHQSSIQNVQSNLSYIQLQWSGFENLYGINQYEYCLKRGSSIVIDWTNAGKQTMAAINGVVLHSGSIYKAEVRASNAGHYVSEAATCDILVLGAAPQLTGKPLQFDIAGDKMTLDWSMVFDTTFNVSYMLTIGTKSGYDDITNSFYTDITTYSFNVPTSTLLNERVTELFFDLTCSYITGMSSQYRSSYKLNDIN